MSDTLEYIVNSSRYLSKFIPENSIPKRLNIDPFLIYKECIYKKLKIKPLSVMFINPLENNMRINNLEYLS